GAFVGSGILDIGQLLEISWVSVTTSSVAKPDGTLWLRSSHHISSNANSSTDFTTEGRVLATPSDAFSSRFIVPAGVGGSASGFLDVLCCIDRVAGHIDSSAGSLCAR